MTKAPQAFSQAPPASPPAPASGPRPAPACSAGRPGSSLPLLDRRPSSVPHAQRRPNPLHPAFCESEVGTHMSEPLSSHRPSPRHVRPRRPAEGAQSPGPVNASRATAEGDPGQGRGPGSEGATPAGAAAPSNSPTARRFAQGASCCAERLGLEHT